MSDISETSFSSEVFSPKGLQTIQCFSINQNANKVVVAGRDSNNNLQLLKLSIIN